MNVETENGGLTILFLDISNGFGSVDFTLMYRSLVAFGIDPATTAFLQVVSEAIRIDIGEGTEYSIKLGSPQGSCLRQSSTS